MKIDFKTNYKYYLIAILITITIILFLAFLNHYKELIIKYLNEALTSSDTWFRRQINNNIDYLFMKEQIESNVSGIVESAVNIPKKSITQHLKEFSVFVLNYLINFFNWLSNAFYFLILIVQVLAVYIFIIFDEQPNKKTNPTPLATALLFIGCWIRKGLNRFKIVFKKVYEFFKKHKTVLLTLICCILFLKGFFFKFAFEIINIIINTDPTDKLYGGMEAWITDMLSWLFIIYLVHVAIKHYVINTIIIIAVILLIINARAKQNRAKNFKKLVKEFAEVDIHELAR